MIFRTSRISKFTVWIIIVVSLAALACLCIWLWFRSEEKAINRQINRAVAGSEIKRQVKKNLMLPGTGIKCNF